MKTFNDAIQLLIETNQQLINKKIDIEVAKAVANNTQVLINAAKVILEIAKFTGNKNNIFLDDEPIELTLKDIEKKQKQTYDLQKL